MRALIVALAVVATSFLGVIAYELVRFDRAFSAVHEAPPAEVETEAQHRERLERETDRNVEDARIILERALKAPGHAPSSQSTNPSQGRR